MTNFSILISSKLLGMSITLDRNKNVKHNSNANIFLPKKVNAVMAAKI